MVRSAHDGYDSGDPVVLPAHDGSERHMDGNSESSVLLSAHDGHDKSRGHQYNIDAGVSVLLINYTAI